MNIVSDINVACKNLRKMKAALHFLSFFLSNSQNEFSEPEEYLHCVEIIPRDLLSGKLP